MTYDASTVVYDGSKLDREALFIHSATEAKFVREGRIEYRKADGYPRVPFFVNEDPDFPGRRVCVTDHLDITSGEVFKRTSPPVITYGDFRFVDGVHDHPDLGPTVTVYCDKLNMGKIFEKEKHSEELILGWFRRDFEVRYSVYHPIVYSEAMPA